MRYLVLAVCLLGLAYGAHDTVQTDTGAVQGTVTSLARAFKGIPYAQPPVGPLRWTDPKPAAPWSGVKSAKEDKPGCPQRCELPAGSHACPLAVSEDCLYLTVYTPSRPAPSPLPVMVFIHGGHFFQGHSGGPLYDASRMVNKTNTIWVGMNYRLGALSWLATGSDIHGNYGTRDQLLALSWVQRNIAAFGGDPRNVTLYGQSAGGISTAVLLSIPEAKGLFHRAIIQSDPFTLPLRDPVTMPGIAKSFAEHLGCPVDAPACMRSKNQEEILNAQAKAGSDILAEKKLISLFLPWSPYVDGKLIRKQPLRALSDGEYDHTIPVIIGSVRDEAYPFIYMAFGKPLGFLGYEAMLASIMGWSESWRVHQMYPPPQNTTDFRDLLSVVATDWIFQCSSRAVGRAMSRYSRVYLYDFDHVSSFNKYVWAPHEECYGRVCHASELNYVFDSGHEFVTYTADEHRLAAEAIDFWTAFAHTGDPNGRGTQTLKWPVYEPKASLMMSLETPQSKVIPNFLGNFCDFWDDIGYGL